MRIAVGGLACLLLSCAEAKPAEAPSARASIVETSHSAGGSVEAEVNALKDPAKRATAVKRLWQLWEDALTKDDKDRSGPTAKALRDAISMPLERLCLDPAVETPTRTSIVKLVADLRDPRTEACFRKTLEDYAPDKTEEEVQAVLRAVAALQLKSLAPQVMKVFTTVQFTRPKAMLLKTEIANAVMAVVGPTQEAELVKLLDAPMPSPDQEAGRNQAFWQIVAARALGELKSEKAVRPLMKAILTPGKGPIATTALVSLVKIGKPSIAPAEKLLRGDDAELAAYAKEQKSPHVQMAAQILAALGSESSTAPLIAALEQAKDAPTRVIVAVALTQLPRSAASVAAFKKTFEAMKYDADTPTGDAKEVMASAASDFFDSSFASYLVKTTTDAASKQAKAAEVDAARVAALISAIKLTTPAQLAEVERLAALPPRDRGGALDPTTIGHSLSQELAQARALLAACKEDVPCYLAALAHEGNQKKDRQFTAIKAAFMIGSLGRDSDRAKIVEALPRLTNDAARFSALKALLALAPKGDLAAADALLKLVAQAEESKDEARVASYRTFTQVAAQLRLRAQ